MKFLIIILAIATVILMVSMITGRKRSDRKNNPGKLPLKAKGNTSVKARNPYRATSITFDNNACLAAQKLGGKRFLDIERSVPKLPLAECDSTRCNCKYEHFGERRTDDGDRRSPNALLADLYTHSGNENRRVAGHGRRLADMS